MSIIGLSIIDGGVSSLLRRLRIFQHRPSFALLVSFENINQRIRYFVDIQSFGFDFTCKISMDTHTHNSNAQAENGSNQRFADTCGNSHRVLSSFVQSR